MNQPLALPLPNHIQIDVKRDDLLHPIISGNKFRKLKYNIQQAQTEHKTGLLTFGGAYSNHIVATAGAGAEYHFKTLGIIRGDELANKPELNPSLLQAQQLGMKFDFVTRQQYRLRNQFQYIQELQLQYPDYYILPEGGTNALAVKGCEEILTPSDASYTHICVAVGTGGTLSGINNTALAHQTVLGFPALKENFLESEIQPYIQHKHYTLIRDYHFGGYGKTSPELIGFLNQIYTQTQIPFDPIYNGKMLYGIMDLIKKDYFEPYSKILFIHTGGLQGIAGINQKVASTQVSLNYK